MSFWQAFWRGYRRARARQQFRRELRASMTRFEQAALDKWDTVVEAQDAVEDAVRRYGITDKERRPMAGRES